MTPIRTLILVAACGLLQTSNLSAMSSKAEQKLLRSAGGREMAGLDRPEAANEWIHLSQIAHNKKSGAEFKAALKLFQSAANLLLTEQLAPEEKRMLRA